MAKRSFVSGTIILMLAGFVVRIFGFIYRIYLSNLIGAEGMGLFQLIFPVYSLVILTLSSGVSIGVSKMVAEELAKKHLINLRRITSCALVLVISSGMMISLFIFLYIDFIANVILKDSRTYYSLMLLIPSIPVIAAASALKGYFYGIQDVVPTAVSQVVEQVVRIGLVMAMAGYFVGAGLEYACALATVGMSLGEISNLGVLFIIYRIRRKKAGKSISRAGFIRKRIIFKELIKTALPVSFNRFITSIMSAVEQILIPRRLLAGGLDYQVSIEMFGKLSGMAMPLIFFPSLVTASLATTLVPAISEAMSLKNYRTVNYRISKSIQLTFILGFIFTALFITFPDEISDLVYRREKIGPMIYTLAFSCIFIYLQQTLLGILNGLGKQALSLRNSVIGSAIRICFIYYMVPFYGVNGYVLGAIVSSAIVCILNMHAVIKATGMAMDLRSWIIKPGLAGAVMLFSGKYVYSFFEIFRAGHTWTVIFTVFGYLGVALLFMFAVGALNKEQFLKMIRKNPKKSAYKMH